MNNKIVLDASALLALLRNEPGAEVITPSILDKAVMSAVNVSEVQAKAVSEGADPTAAWGHLINTVTEIVPFDEKHAKIAGDLITRTKSLGLSLGDRACLALAISMKSQVYTADRPWASLNLGISIKPIR